MPTAKSRAARLIRAAKSPGTSRVGGAPGLLVCQRPRCRIVGAEPLHHENYSRHENLDGQLFVPPALAGLLRPRRDTSRRRNLLSGPTARARARRIPVHDASRRTTAMDDIDPPAGKISERISERLASHRAQPDCVVELAIARILWSPVWWSGCVIYAMPLRSEAEDDRRASRCHGKAPHAVDRDSSPFACLHADTRRRPLFERRVFVAEALEFSFQFFVGQLFLVR
jgi:hypothetical protein